MGDGLQVSRTCDRCGAPFIVAARHLKRGRGRFCSRVCGATNANKVAQASHEARREAYYSTVNDWFWSRMDRSGGSDACWPWLGNTRRGYGRIKYQGKDVIAHRFAATLVHGEPPTLGHFACHSCDNPCCCNPRHLWWGTTTDNMRDCIAKGRFRGQVNSRARKSLAEA